MLKKKKNCKNGITVKIVNPEAIPAAEEKIRKMIIDIINKNYSK
ncbi:hypothetical protein [uncultured Clostridium sp.]|nr:hypothetical protein [uncultured Clostridium sp.]